MLAAEDARDFQPALFAKALVAPDSVVRRVAAMGAGRIGDQRATPLLLPILDRPRLDGACRGRLCPWPAAGHGGGRPLIDRLTGQPALDGPTAAEAITALAKIGGSQAGEFFVGVLSGSAVLTPAERARSCIRSCSRPGASAPNAPVDAILPFVEDTSRRAAGARRTPWVGFALRAAGERLTVLLRDREGYVRAVAARALTSSSPTPRVSRRTPWRELLARAAIDANPQVKMNALRSLGGFRDSTLSADIAPLIADPLPNVQVQAAVTLGELGGSEAVRALKGVVGGKGTFAVRREALVALAAAIPPPSGGRGSMALRCRLAAAGRGGRRRCDRRTGASALVPLRPRRPGGGRGPAGVEHGEVAGPGHRPDRGGPPAARAPRRRRAERRRRHRRPGR